MIAGIVDVSVFEPCLGKRIVRQNCDPRRDRCVETHPHIIQQCGDRTLARSIGVPCAKETGRGHPHNEKHTKYYE